MPFLSFSDNILIWYILIEDGDDDDGYHLFGSSLIAAARSWAFHLIDFFFFKLGVESHLKVISHSCWLYPVVVMWFQRITREQRKNLHHHRQQLRRWNRAWPGRKCRKTWKLCTAKVRHEILSLSFSVSLNLSFSVSLAYSLSLSLSLTRRSQ